MLLFICISTFALEVWSIVDLSLPKTVLLGGFLASWGIFEIGKSREAKRNA